MEIVGLLAGLVSFGEALGYRFGPEAAEDFVIFFGANALVDDLGGSARFGNAVTHEGLWDKGENALSSAELFPCMPIAVAFEMRGEDF